MTTVFDVAKYILSQTGEISAMKLQKLVYYSQAWSLVWDEEALFDQEIQAWANGPVCQRLYEQHARQFKVGTENFPMGDSSSLNQEQRDTVDAVIKYYGEKSAQWLSDLTHTESPWIDARGDLEPTERSNAEITQAAMHEYYSGL